MSKYAGWENFDPVEHTAARVPTPKRKYHNEPTEVDGITFDSAKEARRYQELKLLEKAGEIYFLELQPRFTLSALALPSKPSQNLQVGVYVADFTYKDKTGATVVEDVKGFKTPLYRWKKRHLEAQYGVKILET